MVVPYYICRGEGDKALLFVHGLGENLESWSNQIDYFSRSGCVSIALDLRGHGKSKDAEKKIEMEGFANDVFDVLDSLSVKSANLCGLSMGGLVVLEAYSRRPEVFDSMILVSVIPQYPPAQSAALEMMSMKEIADQVASFAVAPTASVELKRSIAKMISQTNKSSYIQSAEAACAQDYSGMLATIRVPTLLIAGELDFVTPPEAAKYIQKRVPGCRMQVMKGTGHLPNRENPREFNHIVEEFLRTSQGR